MTLLDVLLLLMVVIWGANFSVIKFALREFPQVSFNALRLMLASTVFLLAIQRLEPHAWSAARADWRRIALLGIVGHFFYQLAFVAGVARTSASNAALIFGATPVAVALLAALAGHERLHPARWLGAALSVVGIYIVVGRRTTWSSATFLGDVLVFIGMFCWAIYSVASQPLLRRLSPLVVTGYSLMIGACLYVLFALPVFLRTDWQAISIASWTAMSLSSLLALAFAYIVWYTGVQRIGSSRTAVYSNLTPIVAMIVAAIWLNEPIATAQIVGAALIIGGVFLSRFAPSAPVTQPVTPPES
jgi:drug/metabolite transporter (DMT)-like permease